MEATGVHGWNDPIDPANGPRRPEPIDDPAWLSDRPAPRSSYLFGDEPDRPSEEWYRDQPTEQWQAATTSDAAGWAGAGRHRDEHHHAGEPGTGHHELGGWPAAGSAAPAATDRQVADPARSGRRGRRVRRRSRPLVMGGAAAAATLVVSVGVAALALPGDDTPTNTRAGEVPAATAPALPDEEPAIPFDTLESPSPSPSVSPTTAAPSPTPSRTVKPRPAPTPAQSRSTAASRQGAARQASPSRGTTASAAPSSGATTEAAEILGLVNAERAKAGCGALSIDEQLMTVAQRHSQDQADHRNMSHTGSDGSDPGERIDRVGYSWRTYGENVAWNQQSPAAVMDAWMNSSGHRANILNCSFTEIGIGVASSNGPYWTQVFATPR
ncbi:CAP domain-containing protein [Micromonospora sonchi]|uniref:CAP domain-containing protein n=1 Tax=Micromonospora sonchi TaxID=1763543 RepID=UPI0016661DFB|nr:CAP domain-containing protein [Micromonospora sonchi]